MDLDRLIAQMANSAQTIRSLVEDVPDEQVRWKPDRRSWSVLEVIVHLYDEEREDFRVRLDYILHRPDQPWPPIDPQGWATERRYNERDLAQSISGFLQERDKSIAWLRALSVPDWEVAVEASFGQVRAGDMLAAWVAHDILHMRQLVKLHWLYTAQAVDPYRTRYAGEW